MGASCILFRCRGVSCRQALSSIGFFGVTHGLTSLSLHVSPAFFNIDRLLMIMKTFILIFLALACHDTFGQGIQWVNIQTGTDANFRGLSVADDSVAWVSGSNGWVGRSSNGGRTWAFKQVKDFEKSDFRSLYAFDAQTAIIANAGSPAYILRTTDGGTNWTLVYRNDDKEAFIDGTDFWDNKAGMMYGDPIRGRMLLLQTTDGGMTWKEMPENSRPVLKDGEASFAASGTGIRCLEDRKVIIATGGKVSRLWISSDRGLQWSFREPPIIQGGTMTGIFSIAFKDEKTGIITGGDYERDTVKTDHVFYTHDGGKTWQTPVIPTRGMRECVEYIKDNVLVATGKQGSDISYDGGKTWRPLSDEKFYDVIRKARKGSLTLIAGGKGKLSLLKHEK
jgi:photosystem II stability/assembly factor-like uncharacterized protein